MLGVHRVDQEDATNQGRVVAGQGQRDEPTHRMANEHHLLPAQVVSTPQRFTRVLVGIGQPCVSHRRGRAVASRFTAETPKFLSEFSVLWLP